MKCYEHQDRDAIGTCSRCHKGLCQDSIKRTWRHLYCERCHRAAVSKSRVVTNFFKIIFFGGIIVVLVLLVLAYFK